MGQDDSPYDDEKPAHPVRVAAFSIGQYPVTFAEYDRFCQDTGRKPPADGGWGREDRPVINVSWDDAVAYCEWLSRETGETYRLATEAEWEYACRAGGQTRWCFGDDETGLGEYAWYWENAGRKTHPVGGKKPNPWQLYDVHGNVWEWCADWYSEDYYRHLTSESKRSASEGEQAASSARQSASGTGGIVSGVQIAASDNPTGPITGSSRVIRGGSWGYGADDCRSAARDGYEPSLRVNDLGFRLSRTGPWRSYPVTLGGASAPSAAPGMEGEPAKSRFEPYQVFRDRMGKGYDAVEGPAMIYLPGGVFRMGDERGYDNEKPVHPVRLDAFALGRTPVTVGEYLRFCEATNSHWPEWLEVGSQYHL